MKERGVVLSFSKPFDASLLVPVNLLLFGSFCNLSSELLFPSIGFLSTTRGNNLLLKVIHLLFQERLVGEDVPKGVYVPLLKVLLE